MKKEELWSVDQGYGSFGIEELNFSKRTQSCLLEAGIKTISDLMGTTRTKLMNIKKFGEGSLSEVQRALFFLGLGLSKPVRKPLITILRSSAAGLVQNYKIEDKVKKFDTVKGLLEATRADLQEAGLDEKELKTLGEALAELGLQLRKEK